MGNPSLYFLLPVPPNSRINLELWQRFCFKSSVNTKLMIYLVLASYMVDLIYLTVIKFVMYVDSRNTEHFADPSAYENFG